MKKQLVLSSMLSLMVISPYLACGTRPAQPVVCPAIEVTAVADAGDSTRQVALPDSGTISVDRTPLVTSTDITGARVSHDGDQWGLNVDLNDAAAKRVQEFSRKNVGQKLAVLVDGKVNGGTPKIVGPLSGKGFMITGSDRGAAERLETAIRYGCLR